MDIRIYFRDFLNIFAKQTRYNNLYRFRQISIKFVAVRYLPTAATFDNMHSEIIT
jgi:hypothetical protein